MTPISERTVTFKTDNGVEWKAYVTDGIVCFYGEGIDFEPPADYSGIYLCYDNKFMSLAELSELVKAALPSEETDLNEQRHDRSLSVEGRGSI